MCIYKLSRSKLITRSLLISLFALISISCEQGNHEEPINVNDDFTIEVTEVTTGTIKATITPKDKDMIYVASVDRLYGSLDDVVKNLFHDADLTLMNTVAYDYLRYARDNNLDILEYITTYNMGGKGTIELERKMLEPGKPYRIVVLGFETYTYGGRTYFRATTPVYYEGVTTGTALNKEISFETNVTLDSVIGSDILLDVKPQGWDGLYYYKFYERNKGYDTYEFYDIEKDTPDEQFDHYAQLWHFEFIRYINYNNLEDLEAALRANTLTGEVEDKRFQLKANTEYCLVMYAMDVLDGVVQFASYPHTTYFTTSVYEHSDITFKASFDTIEPRRTIYSITPSVDNEGYCAMLKRVEECEEWSDELLQQSIADQCITNGLVMQGAQTSIENYQLRPDTDYYLICFGLHGESITTPMTKIPFRTAPEREPDSKIESVEICGPFNANALYYYDPVKYADCYDEEYDFYDYCAVGVAVSLNQEPRMIYATFLFEDQTLGKSDEEIIDMLRNYESYSYNYFYFNVKHNVKGRFYALVMDEDGDVDFYASPEEYLFTRDNVLTSTEDVARLAEIYDQALAYYEGGYNASPTAEQAPETMCLNAIR